MDVVEKLISSARLDGVQFDVDGDQVQIAAVASVKARWEKNLEAHKDSIRRYLLGLPLIEPPEDEYWQPPVPLEASEPLPPEFNANLLPDAFRCFVMDIADRMQAPPDFAAVSIMIVAATALGARIGVRPKSKDDWMEVPNLWGAVIGRPSLLKTPSIREPIKLLERLQAEDLRRYTNDVESLGCDPIILDAEKRKLKTEIEKAVKQDRKADAIELANSFNALEDGGGVSPPRRYIVNDSSIEKLGEILSKNPLGILQFRDELLGFLRRFDSEQHAGERAAWLELWDGKGCHVTDRIGRGTIRIERASASLIGSIQPAPLQAYFADAMNGGRGDDGLLQRFQLMVWPVADRQWRLVDRYPDISAKLEAWTAIVHLDSLVPTEVGATIDADGDLPYLRFGTESQPVFDEWLGRLEHEIRSDVLHPSMEAHLAKYRGLMPTLALICHLADGHSGPLGIESAERAVRWCEYLAGHARRVYHAAEHREESSASRLLARLKSGQLKERFTLRELTRKGWAGLSGMAAREAIEILRDHGWLREIRVQTGGKPRTDYLSHPSLLAGERTAITDNTDETCSNGGIGSNVRLDMCSESKPLGSNWMPF